MMRRGLVTALGLTLLTSPSGTAQEDPAPARSEEYKRTGEEALEYRGPGRELPEPDVDEVVLGWFGPGDPDHPAGGDFWRGATLALEGLNAAGGHRGRPYRLRPGWSENPWGTGVVLVTKMVFEHGAWALLGAIDGASAHLAEQVALKTRVTLLSSGSTDDTAHMASVPWFFSLVPSDEVQMPVLVAALPEATKDGLFAVAAATEHDAHAALVELRQVLASRRLMPSTLLEFDPVEGDLDPVAARLLEACPTAIFVLAPPAPAARLVVALRHRGYTGTMIGGAPLASNAFRRAAGDAAEGVVVPLLWQPSPRWDSFARMYENRWGERPDHAATWSYDAVRLVARAVDRAGLNRARIRDAVRELSPWTGVGGVVRWDALGRNEGPVGLATWVGGQLRPTRPPDSMER
jgi:branched-chain amino acid transport system substrate-binding protein